MIILGIETSCDETAIAVLEQKHGRIQILSNIVASSLDLQANFGGVFPEQAAREQLKSIIPVLDQALTQAFPNYPKTNIGLPSTIMGDETEGSRRRAHSVSEDGRRETVSAGPIAQNPPIDAIAVTQGPGLIGSLLIGVETAKTLSLIWNKPLIPVNHLIAHFYANWVEKSLDISHLPLAPTFPSLGLLVSGGHTDLVLFTDHLKYSYLGGTRDDAAGECFDKCARLLGLPYPGGPQISTHAKLGNPQAYKLPRPMYSSKNLDMSFSGLKTAVANLVDQLTNHGTKSLTDQQINDLSASIELTICQVLIKKTLTALSQHQVASLMVAGGVAANSTLRRMLQLEIAKSQSEANGKNCKTCPELAEGLKINLHIPAPHLCTDNGVSTAAAGFFIKPIKNPLDLEANPNLSLAI